VGTGAICLRSRLVEESASLNGYKNNTFNDRATASAKAKSALLEKFRAKPAPDDPEVLRKQAERQAIIDAREKRAAERKIAKEAEAAEQARLEVLKAAERARLEVEAAALKAEEAKAEAAKLLAAKAARDARYAARKARR
jgi:Family of unknown function (DUF6481)